MKYAYWRAYQLMVPTVQSVRAVESGVLSNIGASIWVAMQTAHGVLNRQTDQSEMIIILN